MRPFNPKYNLAIVGAGRQGMSILEALVPPRKGDESLRVIGVADLNPEAPGILYAYRHNLFVTVSFTDLLELPNLDIIINATGQPEVSRQLNEQRSKAITILSVDRPYSWETFWDLISMELSFPEVAPIRLSGARKKSNCSSRISSKEHWWQILDIISWHFCSPRKRCCILASQSAGAFFRRGSSRFPPPSGCRLREGSWPYQIRTPGN